MKKLASLGVVALIALVVSLVWSPTAQAYPEVQIDLTVNRHVLYGGQTFTATATANVTCDWTLEWNGDAREKSGAKFVTTYTAPEVSEITKVPLHGTCLYTAASSRSTATNASWQRTIMITVLPQSSAVSPPGSSDLPNTGGPNRVFLFGGLALLLAGATAVTVARRRAEEAEIAASRA
jgi:LPXTG-motif cell wall-anchored protein